MTAFYETNTSTTWLRKRLKHLGKIYPGLAGKAGEDFSREQLEGFKPFVPFVSVANFMEVPKKYQYVRVRESEGQNKVRSGDLLFLMSSETLEDIGKSSIFEWEEETPYLNSFCKGFRSDNSRVLPKFLNYSLMSTGYREYFANVARGFTRINLKQEYILNAQVSVPPLPEQRAIAAFLDGKCTKIDEAVRIKEEQIKLLRERRQILIQQAVTRGLNPDAPMKDSGIDWIGEIPAHWEVRRSKFLFRQSKELAHKDDIQLSATQSYGVIPQEQFEELVGRRVVKISTNLDKRKHVELNDFVISMRSFQGGLERAYATGCIRSSYIILRPAPEVNPDFFGYLLKIPLYIHALQITGNFIRDGQDLTFENFSDVDLYVPPYQEQAEIAGHIKRECSNIGNAISIKQDQIAMLKEYKTSLINAAVTGKIKVI